MCTCHIAIQQLTLHLFFRYWIWNMYHIVLCIDILQHSNSLGTLLFLCLLEKGGALERLRACMEYRAL